MAYQSINPYDGKILKTFEELTDKQLDTAIATAASCFETWRQRSVAERAAVVAKAAAITSSRAGDARDGQAYRAGPGRSGLERRHHGLLRQKR
jgi:acyl-CoA reductase-like NAD-dependent aldehyde dehydrogenase